MKKIFTTIILAAAIFAAFGQKIEGQTKTLTPRTEFDDLIDRYFDSLNETDGKRRGELVGQVWTDGGTFVYPGNEVKGLAAIAADVERVQKQFPGAIVRRTSRIEIVHGNYVRFNWEFGAPGAKPIIKGIDFAVVSGGKLQLVVGFFDYIAPEAAKNRGEIK